MSTVLVTGGAGFIGSALVRRIVRATDHAVVNVDKLTYAGSLESVADVADDPRYTFAHVDVSDGPALRALFDRHRPLWVVHLAAESHVDRSIDAPAAFVRTNVIGTFTLLEEAARYWASLPAARRADFRFLHVSTDEVFGALGEAGRFDERSPYRPSSPYAASKAAADHFVRAWHHTYGLPVVTSNCSNNYGPFQFPEKLIPLTVRKALARQPIPVYGRGDNVRDWLYVEDHVDALLALLERGRPGETYNVGAECTLRNLDVVRAVCALVDELAPDGGAPRAELVTFVADRPGHDYRYAIDASKVRHELGWHPRETFASGLRTTVEWYRRNQGWCERVQAGSYGGERLGLGARW